MKDFLDENFLLDTETAQALYHEYAKEMPIFDYHSHLPPAEIAEDRKYENLSQIWLNGDHYKWRAMRTNAVPESLITGDASDIDKFEAWAATVPYTIGNPLFHWTHLELQRYFGITEILSPSSAHYIFSKTMNDLQKDNFSVKALLKKSNVKVVCTTDDPVDSLEHHIKIKSDKSFGTKVLPTFRPDKAMAFENTVQLNKYFENLSSVSGIRITDYDSYLDALKNRHDFFHNIGCRISDHALILPIFSLSNKDGRDRLFKKALNGETLKHEEITALKTAVLQEIGKMNSKAGWTMQIHLGALRNNNSRMFKALGRDAGFDSIADGEVAEPLSRFLDSLNTSNELPKTIIYTLNPRDNYLIGTMIGNFQGGSIPGKLQFGSGWWFNDQKEGMEQQISALANLGLLSRFVGMLTDSRSFLSFPRHEYFRRILCNTIGNWVENGEAPNDYVILGKMVEDISYNNAVNYFGIDLD
ncbi:MAG: glucuronate isomerase [Spirochaetia bacterium]|jgi:glucuronate isomerase|nr:glucuronate isomerase [Spirochaetia bacterium]